MKIDKLAAIGLIAAGTVATAHAEDLAQIKADVAKASAPATTWTGPTTGPKAVGHKTVVFVAVDMRNGGALGVANGLREATKAIGWDLRVLDGQGSVSGQAAAMSQAIALKPDAIVLGGLDAVEQKAALQDAASHGIALVGWHAGPLPGPIAGTPLFTNATTNAMDVAKIAAEAAIADSGGKAQVVIFADSTYAIAIAKGRAMEKTIQAYPGAKVLAFEDTPLSSVSSRVPQLTTTLLGRYGARWTYSLAINDLYYDFMPPALDAAGIAGNAAPFNISAGDGSVSAYERIRTGNHQLATVPEPLNMQGWELVDELNRDFAKQPWSGFVPAVHLVTKANIAYDGGPRNVFDPDNNYRQHYEEIWGVK